MTPLPVLPSVPRAADHEPAAAELDALIAAAERRVQVRDERVRRCSAALENGLQSKALNAAAWGAGALLLGLGVRALWRRRPGQDSGHRPAGRQHASGPESMTPKRLAWLGPLLLFVMRSPLPSYLTALRAEQRARAAKAAATERVAERQP